MYWEFHEQGGRRAVRKGNWKLVQYHLFNPEKTTTELYDLSKDIGEENNVAEQHPELVKEMKDLMIASHVESDVFPFQTKLEQ